MLTIYIYIYICSVCVSSVIIEIIIYAVGNMQRSTISWLQNVLAMVNRPAFFVVSLSKAEEFPKTATIALRYEKQHAI